MLGELALGNLSDWQATVAALGRLPKPTLADNDEVLRLIRHEQLMGSGLGWVDAMLLASARVTPGARLWSRDARLTRAAARLGIGFSE